MLLTQKIMANLTKLWGLVIFSTKNEKFELLFPCKVCKMVLEPNQFQFEMIFSLHLHSSKLTHEPRKITWLVGLYRG